MRIAFLLAITAFCAAAQAQIPGLRNFDIGKALDLGKKATEASKEYSQEEEIQLGEGLARRRDSFRAGYGPCDSTNI